MLRTRFATVLLSLIALSLAALCWRQATADIDVTPVVPGAAGAPPTAAPLRSAGQRGVPAPLERLTDTRERPLFDGTRRPVKPGAPAAVAPPVAMQPSPTAEGFKLVGMMRKSKRDSRALIRAPGEANATWVVVGGEVSGWRLTSVDEDGVTLERDGATADLALFQPAGTSAPASETEPVKPPR